MWNSQFHFTVLNREAFCLRVTLLECQVVSSELSGELSGCGLALIGREFRAVVEVVRKINPTGSVSFS